MLGHFKGKKFSFSVFSVLTIALVAVSIKWIPEIAGIFPAFIGGITGVAAAFLAGDVAADHVKFRSDVDHKRIEFNSDLNRLPDPPPENIRPPDIRDIDV